MAFFAVSFRRPENPIPPNLLSHKAIQPIEKMEHVAGSDRASSALRHCAASFTFAGEPILQLLKSYLSAISVRQRTSGQAEGLSDADSPARIRVLQSDLRSPPSFDLNLVGDDPHAALCDQTHCKRVEAMLDAENPHRQACLVVIGMDRHDCLGDDRSCVDLAPNKMHGTTGEPDARRQRLTLRV